jgi:predicted RNA-binding protein associated with RNAse of E/G family
MHGAHGEPAVFSRIMARNAGSDIDIKAQRIRDRDGAWYPVDGLTVTPNGLFYARMVGVKDPIKRAPGQLFFHQQRWILPKQGWVLNRFDFFADVPEPSDWYIEPELVTVSDDLWSVRDGYIDVEVWDGLRYHIDDADELAEGLTSGEITIDDAVAVLHALDRLVDALKSCGISGQTLLAEYAPDLPKPDEHR